MASPPCVPNTPPAPEVALAAIPAGGFARRVSELASKRARKLTRRAETRRQCNFQHRQRRLTQQLAGARKTQRHVVLVHAATEMGAERAFELSERHAGEIREPLPWQRGF